MVYFSLTTVDYIIVGVNDTSLDATTFASSFHQVNQTAQFRSNLNQSRHMVPGALKAIEDMWDLAGWYERATESNDPKYVNLTQPLNFEHLTKIDCINQYATSFQTSRQHVLLVSRRPGEDTDWSGIPRYEDSLIFDASTGYGAYDWICKDANGPVGVDYNCRTSLPTGKDQAWKPFGDEIDYCLSKQVDPHCRLNFNPQLMAIVLISNAFKAAILLYAALRPPKEPLLVLGDAIESFLSAPDGASGGSCLASAKDVRQRAKQDWVGPRVWVPVKKKWGSAITRRRWIMSLIL